MECLFLWVLGEVVVVCTCCSVVEAMRESMGGSATDSGGIEGALTGMFTAFLAQQIPPLQKFDGATISAGTESITEWLEL